MNTKHRMDTIKVLIVLSVLLQTLIVVLLLVVIKTNNKSNQRNNVSYLTVKIVDDKNANPTSDIDTILINSGHINISLDRGVYKKITGNTIDTLISEDEILGLYLDYFGVFGWKLLLKDQNTLFFSKQYT